MEKGSLLLGDGSVTPGNGGMYVYEVVDSVEKLRFGKPALLLTVNKYAVPKVKGALDMRLKRLVESNTKRWSTQLF